MTGGEVQICLTWNFADNVDTSQYRYKNQLPFSARSCHINDKSCLRSRLQSKLQRLHHHPATQIIMCLVFHRVTHLTALFVILGFYPLLKSARHLDMSRTWHNDTWGSRIVSQPQLQAAPATCHIVAHFCPAWREKDPHLPSKLIRSHLSLPIRLQAILNVSFSVCHNSQNSSYANLLLSWFYCVACRMIVWHLWKM